MEPENEEGLSFLELAQAATRLVREWEEDHPLMEAAEDSTHVALNFQTMENLLSIARGAAVETADNVDAAGELLDIIAGSGKKEETQRASEKMASVMKIVQGFHKAVTGAREEAETTQARLLERLDRMPDWMGQETLQGMRKCAGVITNAIKEYEDVTGMARARRRR